MTPPEPDDLLDMLGLANSHWIAPFGWRGMSPIERAAAEIRSLRAEVAALHYRLIRKCGCEFSDDGETLTQLCGYHADYAAQLAQVTAEVEAWRDWYSGKAGHNPPGGGQEDRGDGAST
jgi:hypothetical protein